MKIISELVGKVRDQQKDGARLLFRGVPDSTYQLLPSLLRPTTSVLIEKKYQGLKGSIEQGLFHDFVTNFSGHLEGGWHTLYLMQHHGLPTRLLDWTESLAVALFFSMTGAAAAQSARIWILNPQKLNAISERVGVAGIVNPEIDDFDDYKKLLAGNFSRYRAPVAFLPTRRNGRMIAQQAAFTIHGKDDRGMEVQEGTKDCLTFFDLPVDSFEEIRAFLETMGTNRYTLFTDSDNLALSILSRKT